MKRDKAYLKWREAVISRDMACVICGKGPEYLNAHHLIPKNFKKWSLVVDNGLTLCAGCHTLGRFSAHKNPLWFSRWLRINMNKTYMAAIRRLQELDAK